MKRKLIYLVVATLICSMTYAQNLLSPPKIISSVPEFGNCEVDTGEFDIIIRFDQDMNKGMTFSNSPNFPQLIGKPQWIDSRTLSLPAKLDENKIYSLVLNQAFPKGFSNSSGTILNPEEVMFQTKSYNKNQKHSKQNKKAYKEFIKFFPKEYSYASEKGIDWNEVMKQNRKEFENSKSSSEFAIKMVKALRIAEDSHLWVEFEGQRFETKYLNIVEYNYNLKDVFGMLSDKKLNTSTSNFAGIIDSIGYIFISTWMSDPDNLKYTTFGDTTGLEHSLDDILSKLTKLPYLIIDVRSNSGGNEAFAKKFASRFINKPTPYEKVKIYNKKTSEFDILVTKIIEPNAKQINYSGNIYVLSGPSVYSSNESFILMMKQIENAKVIGMNTYGGSGNPVSHALSNGVIINLPSWQAYSLDGKMIEGNGVEPDIEIKTTRKDFLTKDTLFESVLMMIGSH